jgi:tetratricopeptide (TPR) repeat protein
LHEMRGRYEESLLINDALLKRDPDNLGALGPKAYDLLKLGRPQEAVLAVNAFLERDENWEILALAAAINYELAQYELAAQMAQKATAKMSREELGNRRYGAVRLTQVAAEARLGHASRAKVALADFNTAVPGVQTIAAIKKWMHPAADLADYDPLFEGLRLAGVPD